MRKTISFLFISLIIALAVCSHFARHSQKPIGKSVSFLLDALIPPLIGNLIIILSGTRSIALIGCYIYYIGMDFVMFQLLRFTFTYCNLKWPSNQLRVTVLSILGLDILSFLLNPIFHHAFDIEPILVDGYNYYQLVPYFGQTFHRIIDYLIFFAVLIIFFVKSIRTARIYAERYSVIFATMVFVGLAQTFFIFSRTPIDRSMIGYGIFGILVYYFSIHYRPLRLMDQMLASIASGMNEALFLFDAGNTCIWANKSGIKLAGIKDDNFDSASDQMDQRFDYARNKEDGVYTKQIVNDDGTVNYYILEKHTVLDEKGRIAGSFISFRDNTEEQQELELEQYTARHDSLTGLYTQKYLYTRIEALLKEHPETPYCIIFLNIREFKIINDIFGTSFGDYTLKQVADWIRTAFPAPSIYGRLSGDTFGICIRKDDFIAAAIEGQLSNFTIKDANVSHTILIHLGIYEVSEPGMEVSVMFDRAHMALSTIRDQYKTHIAYYDDEMRSRALWNQHISSQLHDAIKERQIQPYLQPIVDSSGTIVGAEALVRWIHPTDGFLSPAKFVPVFENNGMISEVDRYMWRSACEILARWKKEHIDRFISINISPKDFYFMNVEEELRSIVKEFEIDPAKLRIEITETVMMTDIESRMKILNNLKRDGFIVEIDDFGSGFSSLNMLKDMPVDLLKIDMAFLNKSKSSEKAETILHNIMNMTQDLGISSLTEGVETESQYEMLTGMGCKLFQGYYFAKPMSLADFESFANQTMHHEKG